MTIPLHWLLLLLSALTGIAPVPVSESQMVVVRGDLPTGYAGYTCNGVGGVGALCSSLTVDAVQIASEMWANPLAMQHVAMHEYGHRLFGGSEDEAERYACRTVPLEAIVYDMRCHADGTLTR